MARQNSGCEGRKGVRHVVGLQRRLRSGTGSALDVVKPSWVGSSWSPTTRASSSPGCWRRRRATVNRRRSRNATGELSDSATVSTTWTINGAIGKNTRAPLAAPGPRRALAGALAQYSRFHRGKVSAPDDGPGGGELGLECRVPGRCPASRTCGTAARCPAALR